MITKPALPRFLKVLKYFIKNKRTLIHLKYNYRYRVAWSPSIVTDKVQKRDFEEIEINF